MENGLKISVHDTIDRSFHISVLNHQSVTRCAASLEETQRAPGGVAPPRPSAHYDSSARLARHENPQANRATD